METLEGVEEPPLPVVGDVRDEEVEGEDDLLQDLLQHLQLERDPPLDPLFIPPTLPGVGRGSCSGGERG